MNAPLLAVEGLRVAYGGIQAVKGIDLEVRRGELVALIGANGAGKTTTLKALMRMLPWAGGTVRYAGHDLRATPLHCMAEKGIALVPEGRGVFARLSVEENLEMGAYSRRDTHAIATDMARMYELFPRLYERRDQLAGTLSGGEQQMLAMGRALMCRPQLLLLDEPSMGLAPVIVQRIFEIVHEINQAGTTILLVEQNAKLALQLATRAYVMESGLITLSGDAPVLARDPKVRAAYLGEVAG
ncbi:MAG TPA: ABC transporter ATP-binding protein [Burkholderiales bacterium]|nr:ABC transporter ATP-binding protein [Burkholderiales bacterium]